MFLLAEAILLIFMTVYDEPILHILSVLMFDTALLMIAVSKTGVEQTNAETSKPEPDPEPEPAPEPEADPDPEPEPAPEPEAVPQAN
jgi:hypothetical protein